jgi:hypothetical protein
MHELIPLFEDILWEWALGAAGDNAPMNPGCPLFGPEAAALPSIEEAGPVHERTLDFKLSGVPKERASITARRTVRCSHPDGIPDERANLLLQFLLQARRALYPSPEDVGTVMRIDDAAFPLVLALSDCGHPIDEQDVCSWIERLQGNRPANPPYQGRRTCLTLSFAERKTRA